MKNLVISLFVGTFLWSQGLLAQDAPKVPPKVLPKVHQVKEGEKVVTGLAALEKFAQDKAAKKTNDATTLRQIEQSLNAIHSMKTDFIQRAPDGSVAEGVLYLERPGKLRFDFGEGAPFLVVSNGNLLTFVDYEVKQVSRWPIKKTPLGILVDEEIKFDETIEIPEIIRFAGLVKVAVIDPKRREYGFITLIFEESSMELRAWEIVDAQGYTTRVALVNPEYNVAIDKKLFTYKDPRPSKRGPRRR